MIILNSSGILIMIAGTIFFFLQLQLLGEVRGAMRASDLDRYNELTIHHEIAAKKVRFS